MNLGTNFTDVHRDMPDPLIVKGTQHFHRYSNLWNLKEVLQPERAKYSERPDLDKDFELRMQKSQRNIDRQEMTKKLQASHRRLRELDKIRNRKLNREAVERRIGTPFATAPRPQTADPSSKNASKVDSPTRLVLVDRTVADWETGMAKRPGTTNETVKKDRRYYSYKDPSDNFWNRPAFATSLARRIYEQPSREEMYLQSVEKRMIQEKAEQEDKRQKIIKRREEIRTRFHERRAENEQLERKVKHSYFVRKMQARRAHKRELEEQQQEQMMADDDPSLLLQTDTDTTTGGGLLMSPDNTTLGIEADMLVTKDSGSRGGHTHSHSHEPGVDQYLMEQDSGPGGSNLWYGDTFGPHAKRHGRTARHRNCTLPYEVADLLKGKPQPYEGTDDFTQGVDRLHYIHRNMTSAMADPLVPYHSDAVQRSIGEYETVRADRLRDETLSRENRPPTSPVYSFRNTTALSTRMGTAGGSRPHTAGTQRSARSRFATPVYEPKDPHSSEALAQTERLGLQKRREASSRERQKTIRDLDKFEQHLDWINEEKRIQQYSQKLAEATRSGQADKNEGGKAEDGSVETQEDVPVDS